MGHVEAIGFGAPNGEEFKTMIQRLIRGRGESFYEPSGNCYFCLGDKSGAQIWLFISKDREILGFSPHFTGDARFPVSVTEKVGEEGSMAGNWQAWANPGGDKKPENGLFPLLFNCPDTLTFIPPLLPWFTDVQLSAFAHGLEFWENEEAYALDPQTQKLKMSAEAFIPAEKFTEEKPPDPQPLGFFTGKVISAEERVNSFTDQKFCTASVKTLGGEIDLVWAPELSETIPAPGSIVRTVAWLSGRILDRPRLRGKGLKGLLFGKK